MTDFHETLHELTPLDINKLVTSNFSPQCYTKIANMRTSVGDWGDTSQLM
jgi:hypothetical protein